MVALAAQVRLECRRATVKLLLLAACWSGLVDPILVKHTRRTLESQERQADGMWFGEREYKHEHDTRAQKKERNMKGSTDNSTRELGAWGRLRCVVSRDETTYDSEQQQRRSSPEPSTQKEPGGRTRRSQRFPQAWTARAALERL